MCSALGGPVGVKRVQSVSIKSRSASGCPERSERGAWWESKSFASARRYEVMVVMCEGQDCIWWDSLIGRRLSTCSMEPCVLYKAVPIAV